jgi:hypothetical protein
MTDPAADHPQAASDAGRLAAIRAAAEAARDDNWCDTLVAMAQVVGVVAVSEQGRDALGGEEGTT